MADDDHRDLRVDAGAVYGLGGVEDGHGEGSRAGSWLANVLRAGAAVWRNSEAVYAAVKSSDILIYAVTMGLILLWSLSVSDDIVLHLEEVT